MVSTTYHLHRSFVLQIIKQMALGHAHTLVLCVSKHDIYETTLYVFGCNIFGQLGTGHYLDDTGNGQKFLKSLLPMQLIITLESIALIHTKFFTNVSTFLADHQWIRMTNVFFVFSHTVYCNQIEQTVYVGSIATTDPFE